MAQAVAQTGLDEQTVARIATLYLLVALFGEQFDPHRTLGLSVGSPADVVQDHKKWLLKWLHPDRNPNQNLAGLSVRVLAASAELAALKASSVPTSTEVIRADASMAAAAHEAAPLRKRQLRHVWVPLTRGG